MPEGRNQYAGGYDSNDCVVRCTGSRHGVCGAIGLESVALAGRGLGCGHGQYGPVARSADLQRLNLHRLTPPSVGFPRPWSRNGCHVPWPSCLPSSGIHVRGSWNSIDGDSWGGFHCLMNFSSDWISFDRSLGLAERMTADVHGRSWIPTGPPGRRCSRQRRPLAQPAG